MKKRLIEIFIEENTDPDKCWEWKGFNAKRGYPTVGMGRHKHISLHRYMYQRFIGEIPEGLVIDHLCRNHSCGNPNHLEVVTPKENNMRGVSFASYNAKKTHCNFGHPFSGENLFVTPTGRRRCKSCAYKVSQNAWEKEKEKGRLAREEEVIKIREDFEKEIIQRSLERLRGEAEKMLEAYDAGYDTNTRPDKLLKDFIALLTTNQ